MGNNVALYWGIWLPLTGFIFKRQAGSHRSYVKLGVIRPIVIPTYKEIDVKIIKSNLKTAHMSRDDYFKYLQECK